MIKNKKVTVALVGALVGVGLLLFGGRLVGDSKSESEETRPTQSAQTLTMDEYREALEARIEAICSRVNGAGRVSVVVSLSGGFEYVYASDAKWSGNATSTEYIVVDRGSDEALVLLCERAPSIVGIGVVCEGGGDPGVRGEIVQLLSAAFGVGSHNVHVTCGK